MITFNYIASFFLIALGFYTIITKYNLVKTVIGLGLLLPNMTMRNAPRKSTIME